MYKIATCGQRSPYWITEHCTDGSIPWVATSTLFTARSETGAWWVSGRQAEKRRVWHRPQLSTRASFGFRPTVGRPALEPAHPWHDYDGPTVTEVAAIERHKGYLWVSCVSWWILWFPQWKRDPSGKCWLGQLQPWANELLPSVFTSPVFFIFS